MTNRNDNIGLLIGFCLVATLAPAWASEAVAPSTASRKGSPTASASRRTPARSNAETEAVIRRYIMDHPEVLIESIRQFQTRSAAQEKERVQEAVADHRKELIDDASTPSQAADPGDRPVTVVEFFDYRCGYCRKAAEGVAKLAAARGVRVIYKELPILGPDSTAAAKAALAAAKQNAYREFHDRMMTSQAPPTAQTIDQIATELKLDLARLHADMESAEIDASITRNFALAGALHIESTPTFVIGDTIAPGAIPAEEMQRLIDAARSEADRKLNARR